MATTGWRLPRLAAPAAPAPMCSRFRRTPVSAHCSSPSRAMSWWSLTIPRWRVAAAHISGDLAMREAFENGLDLHKITAARMTGKALDDVTPEERKGAKCIISVRSTVRALTG